MNLPNRLTVARVLMIPFILFFLLLDSWNLGEGAKAITWGVALAFFVVAAVTDYIDGHIARSRNLVTNFGRLMDPLADKLLAASCFVAFVELHILPAWMVIIILLREFLVTGLRSLGVTQNRVIHADRWGKNKTITQLATIITTMVLMCARYVLIWGDQWKPLNKWAGPVDNYIYVVLYCLGLLCVFLTVASGTLYVINNWDLMKDS